MTDMDALFLRRKVNIPQLRAFGFAKEAGVHSYAATLLDGLFAMTVTVTSEGTVSADVVETASGEKYVLHRVSGATGAFVGQIREEYERVLTRIAEACFEPDVFKSEGARRVIQYVRDTYQHEPEYLWQRFPDNAVVRRSDNAKWYLVILTVRKEKLGLPGDGTTEVVDVRMKPEDVAALVDGVRYFPGYHMNKKHWVTLCLDAPAPAPSTLTQPLPLPLPLSVPLEEIFARIDDSFALAAK